MNIINNDELRQLLREYFSSPTHEKPLVICSKPYSGKTTTIKAVAKELGIDNHVFLHYSPIYCPLLDSEYVLYEIDEKVSFDDWLETLLKRYCSKNQTNYTGYKYCVIEVKPFEFSTIDYRKLFGQWCPKKQGLAMAI